MSDLDPTDQTVDAAIGAAADEAGVGREELLKRAIVALADAEGIDVPDAEEVEAIEAQLDDLDAEVDEKVEDLRERFVELYRDLESKAPAEHTHEETAERLDAIAADLDAVADRLDEVEAEAAATATVGEAVDETIDALDDRLARVESRIDDIDELRDRTEGLDDLEARVDDLEAGVEDLEELDDRVGDLDEIEEKLSRVASAVVRVRRRLEAAERDRADRERLDALTAAANREGVRKAKCTNCSETVDIGLLTAPECPHCGRRFAELEPNPGFLGTSRLVVGDRPALDGEVDGDVGGAANATGHGAGAGAGGDVSTRETDGGGDP